MTLSTARPRKKVTINNIPYTIEAVITHNGSVVSENVMIEDHDEITCFIPETIENLLQALQLTDLLQSIQPFSINAKWKNAKHSFC